MQNLDRLFRPKSIAVFGGKSAERVIEQNEKIGFAGAIWPVHPTREQIKDHMSTKTFHSGFGQKIKDNFWPSGSDTGVTVTDAVWCGKCHVDYQTTY